MDSSLILHLAGERIAPDRLDVNELIALLAPLRKAIATVAESVEAPTKPKWEAIILPSPDVGPEATEPLLTLVGMQEGSVRMMLGLSRLAAVATLGLSELMASGAYNKIQPRAYEALRELSHVVVKHHWALTITSGGQIDIHPITINREHPIPEVVNPAITGQTVIYGKLIRIGGKEPAARVQLTSGREITVTLPESLCRDLATRIYEVVGIAGIGRWEAATWDLIDLRGTRILDYRSAPLVETFAELRELSGGRWDAVDAEEYVREMRAEDDE